jgi:multiple sugar transport system substrate-binding protein
MGLVTSRRRLLAGIVPAVAAGALLACSAPVPTSTSAPKAAADAAKPAEKVEPKPAGAAPAGGPGEVRFFTIVGSELPVYQKLVENQNGTAGVGYKINLETITSGGWEAVITKLIASTASGTPPDVARVAGYITPVLAKQNVLADVMPMAAGDKFDFDGFFPRAFPPFLRTTAGKVWGVPTGLLAMVRYYNKDLLSAAGVEVPTDWTKGWSWPDTMRIARQLTKGEGANKVFGLNFGMYDPIWGAHVLWQNDADFYSPEVEKAQVLLDQPNAVEAVEYVRQLAVDHKVVPLPTELGSGGEMGVFLAGRVAMWETHHNNVIGIAKANFKWDVMPLSLAKSGKPVSVQATDHWAVMAQSKNKDRAWELARFLSSEQGETYFAENLILGVPARRKVAEKFKDTIFGGSNPAVHFGSIEVMREAYYTTNFAEIRKTIREGLAPVYLGQQSAQEACKATAAKVVDLLKAQ